MGIQIVLLGDRDTAHVTQRELDAALAKRGAFVEAARERVSVA